MFPEFDFKVMIKEVHTNAATAGTPTILTFIPAFLLKLVELIFLEIEEIFLNMIRRLDRFGIVKGLDPHEICKVE